MNTRLLPRLALAGAALFTLSLTTQAETYRNRDNRNLGDSGEGFYTAPYQLPTVSEVTEIIEQVREIKGVAGIHIMAIEWEEAVSQLVQEAGLLPRPEI